MGLASILAKTYWLVRPYGRRKVALVILISIAQSIAQLFSVALVFPFLALAADSENFLQTPFGMALADLFSGADQNQLLTLTGVLLVVGLFIASFINLFGEFYRTRFTWQFAHWLRSRMLHRLTAKSYNWFTQTNSSVLVKKVTQDVNHFAASVLSPLLDGTSKLLTAALLILGVIIVEPVLALVVGTSIAVFYGLLFYWFRHARNRISNGLKDAWRKMFLHSTQFFTGIKIAKVHGVENSFLQRIQAASQTHSDLLPWIPVLNNGPRHVLEPLLMLAVIVFVLLALNGGADISSILPSLGFLAFAGYRLLPAIQTLYSQLSNVSAMRYTLEEVYDEFNEAEKFQHEQHVDELPLEQLTNEPETEKPSASITLEQVSFTFLKSERKVIKNLSLIIPQNTSLAIRGESGAGKSTLIDIILGLYTPTHGRVLVDGKPLNTMQARRKWQAQIGYVPQETFLMDDTIIRNIAFGLSDDAIDVARVAEVASMAQIAKFIENNLPAGYQTNVGERGVQLSGGQRQRIALARALYQHPRVLILDEATSALDQDTESRFMDVVYGMSHQLTIIVVAHRLSTLERCDKLLRIDDGVLVSL